MGWARHGTAWQGWVARDGHGRADERSPTEGGPSRPPFMQPQLLLALPWLVAPLPAPRGRSFLPLSPHHITPPTRVSSPLGKAGSRCGDSGGWSAAEAEGGSPRQAGSRGAGRAGFGWQGQALRCPSSELGAQRGHWAVAAWQEGAHGSLSGSHPPTLLPALSQAWHGQWRIHSTASHNVFLPLGLVEVKGRAGHLLGGPSAFGGLVGTPLHPPTSAWLGQRAKQVTWPSLLRGE